MKRKIKDLYNELKKSPEIKEFDYTKQKGKHIIINISKKESKGNESYIDQFDGYLDSYFNINNGKKIKLTTSFKEYLEKLIKEQQEGIA